MNWDAIGAIGEVLGSLAVFVTLGYLAVQMRQNTLQMRSGEYNQTMQQDSAFRRTIMTNPDLARTMVEGFANPAELTPPDLLRARQALAEEMMLVYQLWRRNEAGFMLEGEDTGAMLRLRIAATLSSPLGREVWATASVTLPSGFRRLVGKVLANPTEYGDWTTLFAAPSYATSNHQTEGMR